MITDEVVDDIASMVEEKKGREKLPKEENGDQPFELMRGELLQDAEDGREGEVEGMEGGDGPGGVGKGRVQVWVGIPHVGHSKCQQPPEEVSQCVKWFLESEKHICANFFMNCAIFWIFDAKCLCICASLAHCTVCAINTAI